MHKRYGFTLTELIIIIVVISLLATLVTVAYSQAQQRAARGAVYASLDQGLDMMQLAYGYDGDYPPNLAGTDFVPSNDVVTALWTNAPQVRQHTNLTAEENAQLFLNACNANMPIVVDSREYNTSCSFAGVNIHANGKRGSNIVWHGPTLQESSVNLTCGSECSSIMQQIKSQFTSQGGTWPVTVNGRQVPLPEPDVVANGTASRFCLEGRFVKYHNVIAHVSSEQTSISDGPCPDDAELHYP